MFRASSRMPLFDYSHYAFRIAVCCFSHSRIIKTTKITTYSTLLPWFGIVEYVVLLILHFLFCMFPLYLLTTYFFPFWI